MIETECSRCGKEIEEGVYEKHSDEFFCQDCADYLEAQAEDNAMEPEDN